MKLSKFWIAITIAPGFAAPTWSQETAQQREACTPDVMRLCSEFIPDRDRITACLVSRQKELSNACATVFNPPRSTASKIEPKTTQRPRQTPSGGR